ncbi:MAG: type II toxin-antitoxin system Phd/YefM family antitoxin [Cyanobacteria bacterium J06581_3]
MIISKIESATNARKEFFQILDEVAQDSSVVIVKRKDAPNAAIIAEAELNSLVETVHLLRSPKNAQRLFTALERSQQRDLDSLSAEDTDVKQELETLRRYCEQEKEENTVEVIPSSEGPD